MKANHTRVLQQLDETHKRLTAQKASSSPRRSASRWSSRLRSNWSPSSSRPGTSAWLEKENHQLLAAAAERRLRLSLRFAGCDPCGYEHGRAAAELGLSSERTLNRIGGDGVEDYKSTRSEREVGSRVDISRMEGGGGRAAAIRSRCSWRW